MKMANMSPVMFTILLSGIVGTSLSQYPQNSPEQFLHDRESRGVRELACSVIPSVIECIKGMMGDDGAKKILADQARGFLNSKLCGNAAPDQGSPLFMCLGMANLAYFLTKFR